eukprot:3456796-Rhodomonas_salina.1
MSSMTQPGRVHLWSDLQCYTHINIVPVYNCMQGQFVTLAEGIQVDSPGYPGGTEFLRAADVRLTTGKLRLRCYEIDAISSKNQRLRCYGIDVISSESLLDMCTVTTDNLASFMKPHTNVGKAKLATAVGYSGFLFCFTTVPSCGVNSEN